MRNSKCGSRVDKKEKKKERTMETDRVPVDHSTTLFVAGYLKF
jgi:hypothetical protein